MEYMGIHGYLEYYRVWINGQGCGSGSGSGKDPYSIELPDPDLCFRNTDPNTGVEIVL